MKHVIINSLCCIAAVAMLASCNSSSRRAAKAAAEKVRQDSLEQVRRDSINSAEFNKKQEKAMAIVSKLPEEPVFDIVTNMGTIKVKLYKKTPKHRENFAKLAVAGYYDSLLFHRVIKGFMIQGGDPFTKDTSKIAQWGQGGPGYTVPAEFVKEYVHKKGALAAARRGDAANPMKESSGSQFYIVQDAKTCEQLNGDYTVFGETVDGLDVIDKIAAVRTDKYDRPVDDVRIITIKVDPSSQPKKESVEKEVK
jgi:cyclophilin family peptidyl-prolyl cis-trans isomerase